MDVRLSHPDVRVAPARAGRCARSRANLKTERRLALQSHGCLQIHDGIGGTDELPISHYFRRPMVIERLLGDRETDLDAFAQAVAYAAV